MNTELTYKEQLEQLATTLSRFDYTCEILELEGSNGIPVLFCDLPQERFVTFAFNPYPKEEIQYSKFLQICSDLPLDVTPHNKGTLAEAIGFVNAHIPLGHFGLQEDKVLFRYVYSIPLTVTLEDSHCLETISLAILVLELFSGVLCDLAIGKLTVKEALERIQQGNY